MSMRLEAYGPHMMLDLNLCQSPKLNDMNYIFNLLDKLPEQIGMNKLTQPYVFRCFEGDEHEEGVTGVVIIAESHISIHTYTHKKYVFVDVFSCKNFDESFVKNFFIESFQSEKPTIRLCKRGEDFPVKKIQ